MKQKVIVLGAGLVGKAMALDLVGEFEVTAADKSQEALHTLAKSGIQTLEVDLTDKDQLVNILKPFDLVIGAVPGFMGFQTAKTVIEAKTSCGCPANIHFSKRLHISGISAFPGLSYKSTDSQLSKTVRNKE